MARSTSRDLPSGYQSPTAPGIGERTSSAPRSEKARGTDPEKEAMRFALERCGRSLDEARRELEALRGNRAVELAVAAGGVEEALRVLEDLGQELEADER